MFGGFIRGAIKIGPVTLENPFVTFLGDLANIGLPVIRRVTLVIDPVANRDWILEAGACGLHLRNDGPHSVRGSQAALGLAATSEKAVCPLPRTLRRRRNGVIWAESGTAAVHVTIKAERLLLLVRQPQFSGPPGLFGFG